VTVTSSVTFRNPDLQDLPVRVSGSSQPSTVAETLTGSGRSQAPLRCIANDPRRRHPSRQSRRYAHVRNARCSTPRRPGYLTAGAACAVESLAPLARRRRSVLLAGSHLQLLIARAVPGLSRPEHEFESRRERLARSLSWLLGRLWIETGWLTSFFSAHGGAPEELAGSGCEGQIQ
jgi:hypothetical protein